ncbi:acyl-CoA/acyl-ACP dehydrogenase [Saccharopolyspora sp. HNM0983]|uniref:Dibenzothiophene monooxygenase n=1 Tax=Saccharopolyspora montiporae TaxID=2781240 RepID=A0A929G153_9PSEU|nr:acyl-CoA/acyl-ACP dehydrogenase [Saccharopolyspora sp. HNM0983]
MPRAFPEPACAAADLARGLAPGFAERAQEHDASGSFPAEDFRELRGCGLLGLMVPEELGGLGASFADYAAVAGEMAAGSGSTALIFNMHASITGALAAAGHDLLADLGAADGFGAERDRLLAGAAAGSLYAVAMSERGAGSRLSHTRTSFARTADGYRITGAKAFVSGAGHADAYLVTAREDAGAEPAVSYFLVPHGPGVRVEPTWDSLGMRATGSHDVHFDVRVPASALLGGVEGVVLPLAQMMPQWLVASYAAVYAGVARAAVQAASTHLAERGLHELPAVRARVGRAEAAVAAAEAVVREAARRVSAEPGAPGTNRWVWRAKLVAGDTAAEVSSSLLEAAGAGAGRRGHPLERIFRDARCGALQPATSDVCADWLGVAVLDGDPDAEARW